MQALRHYLLAVQFFTRLPITGRLAAWVGYSPAMLRASSAHFTGVGWLVGAVAALVYGLLVATLGAAGAAVAACLSTAATALLTGGFHEDGLADVADALGGAYDRDRALEIMKDSRIGSFGALTLVLALASKLALLTLLGQQLLTVPTLPPQGGSPTWHALGALLSLLLAGHVLSRWWPLWLVRSLPHVGDSGRSKSKPLADQITLPALLAAGLWCLPALALVALCQPWAVLLLALALSALAAGVMGWRLSQRLQGFTGDGLGAVQQLGEIGFYLGAALALGGLATATG